MKKGLLTLLAASLVFVGCQNYDDQFDDLNAQISALKSQVDGLSSLSGQVSALSGTINGLQAGIAAAASSSELSALSSSLTALAADVAAVQDAIATAASADAVAALQLEIDGINNDLDDLLTTSNIYSTDVSVSSAATLDSALALGNKVNVLNASLTITGYAGMDYAKVQTLADRVNTTTGNIVYSAYNATGTEIKFNNLTSANNITMTQPGGYNFPKLISAGTIDLKDDYETSVTDITFPALTTATSITTDAGNTFEIIFLYATNVDFGALVTAPSNTITITTKKGATLDLGAWVSKTSTGTYQTATVALNGPSSWTNGTAAGTFASTGLPGNTLGAHDGAYTFTNVATVAVHNFRGTITVNGGVTSFTGNNIVEADLSSGADLETVNITMIRDNDSSLTSAEVADLGESAQNTAQDLTFTSSHAKLTSATITGKTGDIAFTSVPLLATVDLTGADAFNVTASGNASLASWTDASKAEDRTFINNDLMTSVNLSATTKLSNTTDYSQTVEVSGNAELTSLTLGMNNISTLNITSNPKLATLSAASLTAIGTASQTSANVDIHQNALVASSIVDTKEAPTVTVVQGAASDAGTVTTASGVKTLDTYIDDAVAATGVVSVWFDTVSKLETQATYGGALTDVTTSLTAPTSWTDANAKTNAGTYSSPYTGYYAYAFNDDAVVAENMTTGARDFQAVTYVYDVGRNAATYAEKLLATNEGFTLNYTGGSTTWKQGDTYNCSTVTTVDQLVAYMNADTTLDALGIDVQADRDAWYKTLLTMSFNRSTAPGQNTAGTVSGAGRIAYTVTVTETGAESIIYTQNAANDDTVAALVDDLEIVLGASTDAFPVAGTNDNQLLVTRSVSGGTASDHSPLGSIYTVTPIIDAAQTSTTVQLYDATGTISNTLALGSNNFSFDVTETLLTGIRVTLKNVGSSICFCSIFNWCCCISNCFIN